MAGPSAERTSGRAAAASPSARLAFLEALIACDTQLAAAQLGVAWFVRNGGVRAVVVALVEHEPGGTTRLVGVAAHGVRVEPLAVDVEDREHPLVQAMLGKGPVVLAAATLEAAGLAFRGSRCTVYPLPCATRSLRPPGPASHGRAPVGVVIFAGAPKNTSIAWAIHPLGRKVADLASLRALVATKRELDTVPDPVLLTAGEGRRKLAAEESDENYRRLREAEAAVRAERDRLDLIIDSVVDPIIVTDANGTTIMTNAPAERLFTAPPGAPLEEVQRVRANDAHFSSHVAKLFSLEPGGRFRGELTLSEPKSAATVPVEAISGKLVSRGGEDTAIVTILHDLTEQMEKRALYEELKQASSLLEEKVKDATGELVRQNKLLHRQAIELEAASSAKSLFLANMSHEFRTPLNAILGYTSMMLQGVSGPLPANLVRQLSRIDSNGRHLLTIINDILDIARIEAGKMPFNPAKFVVGDLVKEVLAELEPLIVRSKLDVRAEVGKVVPILNTDRAKVKQILVNLISNALKFTPKGSVTVSAQWNKRTNETWISVADTGIGIDTPDLETVFQDFRQVDNSPTRQYGGTGLGLAICRRLAVVLGGDIRLASKVDRGSTFTVVLPAKAKSGSNPPSTRGGR